MAEYTPQGTPLEEDHTADTGTVFQTVPLYINNKWKTAHLITLSNAQPVAEVSGHEAKFINVAHISIYLNFVFK